MYIALCYMYGCFVCVCVWVCVVFSFILLLVVQMLRIQHLCARTCRAAYFALHDRHKNCSATLLFHMLYILSWHAIWKQTIIRHQLVLQNLIGGFRSDLNVITEQPPPSRKYIPSDNPNTDHTNEHNHRSHNCTLCTVLYSYSYKHRAVISEIMEKYYPRLCAHCLI